MAYRLPRAPARRMLSGLTMSTRERFLLFCSVALLAFVGCANSLDGSIDYELGGGFSGIRTDLHVEPDGAFTVSRHNDGTETGQLDAAALDDLQRKVDEAQFPTLEAEYGCGGCTDDLVHTISVHVEGSKYLTRADDGASYPERLRPLIETLKGLAQGTAP
jgi:hypothetical protein